MQSPLISFTALSSPTHVMIISASATHSRNVLATFTFPTGSDEARASARAVVRLYSTIGLSRSAFSTKFFTMPLILQVSSACLSPDLLLIIPYLYFPSLSIQFVVPLLSNNEKAMNAQLSLCSMTVNLIKLYHQRM